MSDSHDSKHAAHAGHSAEEVDRHVRAAYFVFGSLLVLTGFTVGAYFLHLPKHQAIALALVIATIKGSLVAAWFMHLVSERQLIYWMLVLTVLPVRPLLLLPMLTVGDHIHLREPCRSRASTSSSSRPPAAGLRLRALVLRGDARAGHGEARRRGGLGARGAGPRRLRAWFLKKMRSLP